MRGRAIRGWGVAIATVALSACYDGGMTDVTSETSGSGSVVDDDDTPEATTQPPATTGETSGGTGGNPVTTAPPDDDDDGNGDESSSTSGDDPGTEGTGSTGEIPMDMYEEIDGIVAVEAEHAFEIDDNGTERQWYVFTPEDQPVVEPDHDPPHWDTASGDSCLEGLPDTRVTHDDQLQSGVNFYPSPGDGPILRYRVWINDPGRYWVRVRAYSTGTEDNGIHVGLDGEWPETGARIQWCQGKNQWTWSGAQRTNANHCGEANQIYLDIDEPGEHEIAFSMREDGFEMDKWMMTNDSSFFPEGAGPDEVPYGG